MKKILLTIAFSSLVAALTLLFIFGIKHQLSKSTFELPYKQISGFCLVLIIVVLLYFKERRKIENS
tara:strand:+ start:128945 stop:129142 length:198 start_codon:yes stop_codon:yes gene_type:complete